MRLALGLAWGLFIIGSWLLILLTNLKGVWLILGYGAIIAAGLVLYTLKLRYIDNTRLSELNFWTLLLYVVLYAYYLVIGYWTWIVMLKLTAVMFPPELFHRLFPNEAAVALLSRRGILIGALMGISGLMLDTWHGPFKQLQFTNKTRMNWLVLTLVALSWLAVSPDFIGMFVTMVGWGTMPDPVKVVIERVMSFILRRDIKLVGIAIDNNGRNDVYNEAWDQYLVAFILTIVTPAIGGIIIHAQVAMLILSMCMTLIALT